MHNYVYENEDLINAELKCVICHQPIDNPVSTTCNHTFCKNCITEWYRNHQSCPICRQHISSSDLSPVTLHLVLNQLNRLSVKCTKCNQGNIQRDNYEYHRLQTCQFQCECEEIIRQRDMSDHEKICRKQFIKCTAAELGCIWTARREELYEHTLTCVLVNSSTGPCAISENRGSISGGSSLQKTGSIDIERNSSAADVVF
ncbi:unnamed protein product [Didymodactylos carnosus]|uniref:RING-type domain-containing protein n=1 Tax=Didymodactylos carnosus TaxID=1234261 RepID=A0A815IZ78_9BILA|nr:unnamed protein product [Didymodactylos carnosus]CAF4265394.1 unnamed protein product [Didymodactylos carnosus]